MKRFNKILGTLFVFVAFVALFGLLHAQDAPTPTQLLSATLTGTPTQVEMTDVDVMLQAIEGTTPYSATIATNGSNFYSAQHAPGSEEEWPPLPADVLGLNVWPLGEGVFILDDRNVNYNALQPKSLAVGGMRTMDDSGPPSPDGGGGTNTYSPDYLTPQDYGTNLWLAITNLTGNTANLMISNTLPDIQYEIQGEANLSDTQWISEGFVLGSEITNWTPTSVSVTNHPTQFLRVHSWADDGSGLPIWWQLQYFGHTGVDPNGNPEGDGWSNIQKFQNGMNPNVFYTPAAPQGLTVAYNASSQIATIHWQPATGSLTGYALKDSAGNTYNLSSSVNTYAVNVPNVPNRYPAVGDPTLSKTFQIQGTYTGGNSALDTPVPVEVDTLSASLITSPANGVYLVASRIPANAVSLYLKLGDFNYDSVGDTSHDVTHVISISAVTNGLFQMPVSWSLPPTIYQAYWLQSSNADGSLSAGAPVACDWFLNGVAPPPFYDGRVQLKQNLIFQYRAADAATPFGIYVFTNDLFSGQATTVLNPTDYVYAGFYDINNYNLIYGGGNDPQNLNVYLPFEDNELYQNFVFNPSTVDANGFTITGVRADFHNPGDGTNLVLMLPPTYNPSTNSLSLPPALGSSLTRWLCTFPLDMFKAYQLDELGLFGFSLNVNTTPDSWTLNNNVKNYWGLTFSSAKVFYLDGSGNLSSSVLSPGNSVATYTPEAAYLETAQPQLQTLEYDFWKSDSDGNLPPLPGNYEFSVTNQSDLIILSLGGYVPTIAAYEKVTLSNGYSDAYGYLQQYLDKAYKLDANGNITTNQTGVVSPYGSFYATDAGAATLLTMPDPDTGARGTGIVFCVGLALDKNHDGKMDLSFGGVDATSTNSPDQIWVNNNYDRWKYDLLGLTNEQDDTFIATVPDCNYTVGGLPAIPCPRDLEDYFRLWTPGLATLMKALPNNYTVRLTLAGDGQIRIFQAVEPNGGTNYLFDETTASNQIASTTSNFVGLLTSSSPINLSIQNNFNDHFIFCGAHTGSAQIDLQVLDASQNVIADSPAYLQISDIKQMYERWTVGDDLNTTSSQIPLNVALKATDGLAVDTAAFQYPQPPTANTPYILFVHGWNQPPWEKDRFAETAFKRLYWQGYQGRFGSFRWPTYADFPLGSWSWSAIDPRNFDKSESNAWASATGLTNLLTQLGAEYPTNVYLIAHSMGNVVAGEALRLAGTKQLVETYTALQGAIASHAYDSTTPTRNLGIADSGTPDRYANYYTSGASSYFNSSEGAGTYVNFFNTNDWALVNLWEPDQNLKPDNLPPDFPGYFYSTPSGTHPSGFYKIVGSTDINFSFPADTYTIFAFCDEARSRALGSQINVGGAFKVGLTDQQVELDISPYGFGGNHVDHSGEFRSDNAHRAAFWNTVLVQMKLK